MKILIGIPAYNFQVHSGVLLSLSRLQTRHETKLMSNSVSCIPQARNEIVQQGIKMDMDYVLFWDSDVEVLKKNFLDNMVELSKKNAIVCAPYLLKMPERRFNLLDKGVHVLDIPSNKPFDVDAGGTGLMLIPIRIFKELDKPYFRMIIRENDFWPEDWDFCLRAKEKGFKTIVDSSIGTRHWGIYGWSYQPHDS